MHIFTLATSQMVGDMIQSPQTENISKNKYLTHVIISDKIIDPKDRCKWLLLVLLFLLCLSLVHFLSIFTLALHNFKQTTTKHE